MKTIESPTAAWREEVLARSPAAYYTHTPAYQSFCSQAMPVRKDCSLGFEFDNGTRGFIPIQQVRVMRGIFQSYESCFKGYGGLVADGPLDGGRAREALDAAVGWCLARRFYRLTLTTSPVDDSGEELLKLEFPSQVTAHRESADTSVIRLLLSYDEIARGYRKDRKSDLKRARRAGVQVEVARAESQFQSFHEIYRDRVARWGNEAKTNYPPALFRAAYRVSQRDSRLKLWMASHEGKDYAGALILYQGATAFYWIGVSLEDDRHSPNTLMLATIIEDACQRGFKFFDMGHSGRPSLLGFKGSFGATPMTYQSLTLVKHRAERVLGLARKVRQALHI
jgi:hypothetical protein